MAAGENGVPVETLCKLLDLTPRRVQQLAADGIIPKAERGRYELATSIRNYVRYLRENQGDARADWATERTRKVKEQADAAAMENAVKRGELLNRDDVHMAVTAAFARVRAKLLAIPTKIAPLVIGLRAIPAIKDILAAHVHEALRELASTEVVGDAAAPEPEALASGDPGGGAGLVADPKPATDSDGQPVGGRGKAAQRGGKRRAR